jgi:hypothetical protein
MTIATDLLDQVRDEGQGGKDAVSFSPPPAPSGTVDMPCW